MPSKIVVALDSLKGSLSANDAVSAFTQGWKDVRPSDIVLQVPFADGGEGTMDCFQSAFVDSEIVFASTSPGELAVPWLKVSDDLAVIELAAVCGLHLTGTGDPMGASTRRLGYAILSALEHGCGELVVTLGGSGSSDGGAGLLTALGAKLLDENGEPIKEGNQGLATITSTDLSGLVDLSDVQITVLTDVTNPLYGPNGAAYVYAPQKGATEAQLPDMDRNLRGFAEMFPTANPLEPGMGAAGGSAFGLSVIGGKIKPGAQTMIDLLDLRSKAVAADLLVVGEGKFDSQSIQGKAVGVLTTFGRDHSIPVALVAGVIAGEVSDFEDSVSLSSLLGGKDNAIAKAEQGMVEAGRALASRFQRS